MKYTIIKIKSRKVVDKQEILDCIIDCSELRTKLNIDKDKLKGYRKKVKEGIIFPNVELYDDLYNVKIKEGNHRIQAHKEEGKNINATITRDLIEYIWTPCRFAKKNFDRMYTYNKVEQKEMPNAT